MASQARLGLFLLLAAGCQYVTGLEDLEIVASSQGAGPQGGAPSGAGGVGAPGGAPTGGGGAGSGGEPAGGFGGEGGAPAVTTTIHDGSAQPLSLAQNDTTLFFSDGSGRIWRWLKALPEVPPQVLIHDEVSPQNLWATDTELYWSAGSAPDDEVFFGQIANLPTTRAMLASGSSIKHIQVDPLGAVFYADSLGVHNVTTGVTVYAGSTQRIDVQDLDQIFLIKPELEVVPTPSGPATNVMSGSFGYVGLASDTASVFAIESIGIVARADKDDGDRFPLLANAMDVGRDIAVDDATDDVYFTGNVTVWRTSKTGGAVSAVATGASPQRLLVDADNVYWLDSGTADVMRTTR